MYSLMSIYSVVHRIQPFDSATRLGTLTPPAAWRCHLQLLRELPGTSHHLIILKKNNMGARVHTHVKVPACLLHCFPTLCIQ